SFKHEFLLRIARAFPLAAHLGILNNRFRDDEEATNNKMISIVEFDHLTHLSIYFQRAIFAEQFLVDTCTSLPNLIHLYVSYNSLVTVAENFVRHETLRNCSKGETLIFNVPAITVHSREF
ncbi:unnamed protein product, partial [Rotaria socialis]